MFGAIATWNGETQSAVQRHVAYISTHEGALHEQHRASRWVDSAAWRADSSPAACTRDGSPAAAQPGRGPPAPATAGRSRSLDAGRVRRGVRPGPARQPG
jgi:hypothetical protein